jgi:hypothetical protein
MICPICETEYASETEKCPDCGCDLVEELPEDSERLALELLLETRHRELLGDLTGRLEEAGIPYVVQSGTALPLFDGEGLPGGSDPAPWQARVLVVSAGFAEAGRMLGEVRAEHSDLEEEWQEEE